MWQRLRPQSTSLAPMSNDSRVSGRWFFVGIAVAAAVTVFLGFARTYYLKSLFPMPSFPWLFHIHGALFTAWMLLLVLQAALIADTENRAASAGRTDRRVSRRADAGHRMRRRGRGGPRAGTAQRRGGARGAHEVRPRAPAAEAMIVPLTTMLLFGVFAGAGLAWRRRPDVHKRFMALATIAMLPAAIGRAMGWLFGGGHPALFFGAVGFFFWRSPFTTAEGSDACIP